MALSLAMFRHCRDGRQPNQEPSRDFVARLHAQVGFVTARSTFRCGCVTVDPWVIHRGGNLMSLQSHLSELAAKHKALESELQDALSHPSSSDQEIAELKRKKLKLKDEMIRLESQLSRH
jgi:hypothetical protein